MENVKVYKNGDVSMEMWMNKSMLEALDILDDLPHSLHWSKCNGHLQLFVDGVDKTDIWMQHFTTRKCKAKEE